MIPQPLGWLLLCFFSLSSWRGWWWALFIRFTDTRVLQEPVGWRPDCERSFENLVWQPAGAESLPHHRALLQGPGSARCQPHQTPCGMFSIYRAPVTMLLTFSGVGFFLTAVAIHIRGLCHVPKKCPTKKVWIKPLCFHPCTGLESLRRLFQWYLVIPDETVVVDDMQWGHAGNTRGVMPHWVTFCFVHQPYYLLDNGHINYFSVTPTNLPCDKKYKFGNCSRKWKFIWWESWSIGGFPEAGHICWQLRQLPTLYADDNFSSCLISALPGSFQLHFCQSIPRLAKFFPRLRQDLHNLTATSYQD